ncbi:MAG TPA: hypothetical protein PKM75_02185 [Prolixibacteraceae bacterium]|nr:hypothetical protein [Prolixibacteraceae bacterium]
MNKRKRLQKKIPAIVALRRKAKTATRVNAAKKGAAEEVVRESADGVTVDVVI